MTCPNCDKASDKKYRPFCSKRCSDVDLGKWLNGEYRFAPVDPDDFDISEEASAKESPPLH